MLTISPKPKEPFKLLGSDDPHLAKIPQRLTEPLCMAHAGNGYEFIASELKIPVGTVKSRIHRARERILVMRARTAAAAASQQQLESADD